MNRHQQRNAFSASRRHSSKSRMQTHPPTRQHSRTTRCKNPRPRMRRRVIVPGQPTQNGIAAHTQSTTREPSHQHPVPNHDNDNDNNNDRPSTTTSKPTTRTSRRSTPRSERTSQASRPASARRAPSSSRTRTTSGAGSRICAATRAVGVDDTPPGPGLLRTNAETETGEREIETKTSGCAVSGVCRSGIR